MIKEIGATYTTSQHSTFRVYAPHQKTVEVELRDETFSRHSLQKDEKGYWSLQMETLPTIQYRYILNGKSALPDPASRHQPEGVHSWSQLYPAYSFEWSENGWENPSLKEYIIYEIHAGTFTPEGTFKGIIEKLDYLVELGITAIELMPVSPFAGNRNWGYDGVFPYAIHQAYGGPDGLKELVNACHQKGLAVILDVVYNHLGPEGNYLGEFGPYFTEKYHTPWGAAINYDDACSDEVRHYFIETARQWLQEFRIDALRLDAVHAILDQSATHLLQAMRNVADEVEKKTGRKFYLIAETDRNDVHILKPYRDGGYGLDAQWADDFHHALHTLVTGENKGYYHDYGKVEDLAKAFQQAFIYDGKYSSHRQKTVGTKPEGIAPEKFVVCIQNHDQVGNRGLGERLNHLVSFEMQKLAAGLLLISPYTPLLFMGEEYAEDSPFQYFVSQTDQNLVDAVRQGRREEFKDFDWQDEVPDPQSETTFNNSKLQWNKDHDPLKQALWEWYRFLIKLRKKGVFISLRQVETESDEKRKLLILKSIKADKHRIIVVANFSSHSQPLNFLNQDDWKLQLASSDVKWGGPGSEWQNNAISAESLLIFTHVDDNISFY